MQEIELALRPWLRKFRAVTPTLYVNWGLCILFCLWLKWQYKVEGTEYFRWMLSPVAIFSNALSGEEFVWNGAAGYLAADGRFAISKFCAGINYMICVQLLLVFGFTGKIKGAERQFFSLLFFLTIAWMSSLLANTSRICTLILLDPWIEYFGWQLQATHEVMGTFLYLFYMIFTYLVVWKFARSYFAVKNKRLVSA